jgi:hypothetical protein
MDALTNLAYLMEGQILYCDNIAYQYDKEKSIILSRKPTTVWTFTKFCVSDFIKLSDRKMLSLTPDPVIWSKP